MHQHNMLCLSNLSPGENNIFHVRVGKSCTVFPAMCLRSVGLGSTTGVFMGKEGILDFSC